MRICIHRGACEIGGTCVEIESSGQRVVLDVGLPLEVADPDAMVLHPVPGFDRPDPSLLGVVISHAHQDHYGLAYRLPAETTFLIGAAAQGILEAADSFTPAGLRLQNVIHLNDRVPIILGPFTITPFLVDHSAYDAYAILVEADGKRLFYSGDFRAHGHKSKVFERLIADPPTEVDVLLMEGTTLGRPESAGGFPTEDDLLKHLVDQFAETDGLVLVWTSSQNIDRLVTLYKACRRTGRQFIIDLYTAHVLRATGNERLPQGNWRDIRIFLPYAQKMRILRDQSFELANVFKPYRVYPETLPDAAERSVMLFRPSMIYDLDSIDGLKIGRLICSLWRGYLEGGGNKPLIDWLARHQIPLDHCHTSGHADIMSLRRLREAFATARLVPIHHAGLDEFRQWFAEIEPHADREWWLA